VSAESRLAKLEEEVSKLVARVAKLEGCCKEGIGKHENDECYEPCEYETGRVVLLYRPPNNPSAKPIKVCPNCRIEDGSRPILQYREATIGGTPAGWCCPVCKVLF